MLTRHNTLIQSSAKGVIPAFETQRMSGGTKLLAALQSTLARAVRTTGKRRKPPIARGEVELGKW
jgi:hypothetical protein